MTLEAHPYCLNKEVAGTRDSSSLTGKSCTQASLLICQEVSFLQWVQLLYFTSSCFLGSEEVAFLVNSQITGTSNSDSFGSLCISPVAKLVFSSLSCKESDPWLSGRHLSLDPKFISVRAQLQHVPLWDNVKI